MKKNHSIILSLFFLCFLFSCENKQESRIIGDYYLSRQMYPELRYNHEAMNEKVFSVFKDGTGYSYFPIKNKKSDNKGKFSWSVYDALTYRILWDNGETSYVGFKQGRQNKDILIISIYDQVSKQDKLQYIGEKMTLTELKADSLEYAEIIRKKDISSLQKIKNNLPSQLAEWAQIMASNIDKNRPFIIDDFDKTTDSLNVDECMILYYLLEELSMKDSESKKNGIIYFNNTVNYLLSKHNKKVISEKIIVKDDTTISEEVAIKGVYEYIFTAISDKDVNSAEFIRCFAEDSTTVYVYQLNDKYILIDASSGKQMYTSKSPIIRRSLKYVTMEEFEKIEKSTNLKFP